MKILRQHNIYSDFLDLLPFNFFDRSARMKELHASGRYVGTSKIGDWNKSDEKRERMKQIREKNQKDKNSHGYGSEYHMRLANKTLLHNKFQGENGYFYFLEFPEAVKVGFSKEWHRRTEKQIQGGRVILIISGPTPDLADLEFNTLIKFQDFTKLDETGTRYTEYLDKNVKKDIFAFLNKELKNNNRLKIIVRNKL